MKEITLRYISYNVWANERICGLIQLLSEEQATRELGGSFKTLRQTLAHVYGAESIWLQRLQLCEQVVLPETEGIPVAELCQRWLKTSGDLLDYTRSVRDERGFEHVFHYHSLAGEFFKSAVWECLHHVCNHSTFHRGQLINYLRMLAVDKIPSTDFITYTRSSSYPKS
ncbi:MAG TPA: DinB family protein [Chitinophagaceae bacterium]|nr:DinB family protein [Chitinophagaceae bacterium]